MLLSRLICTCAFALTLLLQGCGGGGHVLLGHGSGRATLTLFATDNFSQDYTAVWVRIYQIDLIDMQGQIVTVYTSSDGEVMNLSALSDGQPLYRHLGSVQVPVNTYSLANVILGEELKVVPAGSTTAQSVFFDSGFQVSQGRTRIPVRMANPIVVSHTNYFTLDFDLSQWQMSNDTVIPLVVTGTNEGLLDPDRHTSGIAKGFISCLTGTLGSRHFLLTFGDGRTISVTTDPSTVVYHADGTGNPVLANRQLVEITGTYDPLTRSLPADEIQIDDFSTDQTVVGSVEWVTLYAMKINARFLSGLFPYPNEIDVRITNETKTYIDGGLEVDLDEFVAYQNTATNSSPMVKIEGQYDEGTRTLIATWIRAKGPGGQINVVVHSVDSTNSSLKGQTRYWSGFEGGVGLGVTADLSESTQYYLNGVALTSAQFFARVQPGDEAQLTTEGIDRWGWYRVARVDLLEAL